MGLFDFFKKKRSLPDDQAVADSIIQSMRDLANSPPPEPISNKDYQDLRQKEMDWLEQHYDFSSIESVNAIPERSDLPRPPGDSATGDVYYYLKYKARLYEESSNIDLAIACFRKSIKLMQLQFGALYGREECYSFVRMLARNGFITEAYAEKKSADCYYGPDPRYEFDVKKKQRDDTMVEREAEKGKTLRDYTWINEHFPEKCPTSVSSYRRMRTQNTKNFQFLKQLAAEQGREI